MPFSREKINLFPHFLYRSNRYFLVFTFLLGLTFFFLHFNFQNRLSEESFGRNLYCFQQTQNQKVPILDYDWSDGPLLPHYYALIFHALGPTIQNAVLGYHLLVLANGILVFFIAACLSVPSLAFACAASYWLIQNSFLLSEIFPGLTAAGELCCFLLVLIFFLKTRQTQKTIFIIATYFALFLLLLSNLFLGICLFVLFILRAIIPILSQKSPSWRYKRWSFFLLTVLTIILISFLYSLCLPPNPWFNFNFSVENIQHRFLHIAAIHKNEQGMPSYPLLNPLKNSPYAQGGTFFIIWLIIQVYFRVSQNVRKNTKDTPPLFLILFLLILCFLFFLVGGDKDWLFFSIPLLIILFYLHLDLGTKNFTVIRVFLLAVFIAIPLFLTYQQQNLLTGYKKPQHLFQFEKNRVFTAESLTWLKTVASATKYIQQNTKKGESLFVYPPRALVYFLTNKSIPERSLDKLGPLQETEIITGLKTNAVDNVLVISCEKDLPPTKGSAFPLLDRYLLYNYREVSFFTNPVYLGNSDLGCAIRIFKRLPVPRSQVPTPAPSTIWVRDELLRHQKEKTDDRTR